VEITSFTPLLSPSATSLTPTVYYVRTHDSSPFASLGQMTYTCLPPSTVILYHTPSPAVSSSPDSSSTPVVSSTPRYPDLDRCLCALCGGNEEVTIVRWYGDEWGKAKDTTEFVLRAGIGGFVRVE